ncbi:MAG: arylsulfatase [Blastocatellia bacterium]|nr:arylsulfatase [Blastocatellia bacterium]
MKKLPSECALLVRTALAVMARTGLSLLALSLASTVPAMAQDTRPNILIVLFDDVGLMDFGAYGSDTRTPTIDALAKKGVMLSRFHSSPFCGPSRAMLLTGMDNHQVGMGTLMETVTDEMRTHPGYSMLWSANRTTIASHLSAAGYKTYVTGKWGIGESGANLPNRFGFDRSYVMDATGGSNYNAKPYLPGYNDVGWFEDGKPIQLPNDYYSSRNLVDKMINYIDGGAADAPFFAFLSLQAVHIPVQVAPSYIDSYNGVFDAGWDVMRKAKLQRAIGMGLVPPSTKLAASPKTHRAWDSLTAGEKAIAAREMQVNAGMMTAADEHLGRLLAHLEATGKLENTIVIVTSDNGAEGGVTKFKGVQNLVVRGIELIEGFDTSPENMGQINSLTAIGPEWASVSSAPFDLYKFYGSEGGLRVPFIAAGPGIQASGILDAPVHVSDLVPTILDAARVPYDAAAFFGRSAFPVLAKQAERSRPENEGFGFEVSGNAALYRGQWKITRLSPPLGDTKWRLYDLSTDPGETTDVSAANAKLFESMLAEYKSYSEKVGVIELGPEDSAFKELFKNVAKKALHKYWPYALGTIIVLAAALYLTFRLVRGLLRPAAANS